MTKRQLDDLAKRISDELEGGSITIFVAADGEGRSIEVRDAWDGEIASGPNEGETMDDCVLRLIEASKQEWARCTRTPGDRKLKNPTNQRSEMR